jgi:hypothetical protein
VKFFFPDSQDLVDPSFDFVTEKRSIDRVRQRDDVYAHEVFTERPYDGLLVSKGIVDGVGGGAGKYTIAQRQRLLRVGAREFFRTDNRGEAFPVVGDCGAFTYVRESVPPFSAQDVLDFYAECQFDFGISVDHVILAYKPAWDAQPDSGGGALEDARRRQAITLELADAFLRAHRAQHLKFQPMGVAQGWSPRSYAHAVEQLQKMGYRYIAVGGMVPLKTGEILDALEGISAVRRADTGLHLLGVTRIDQVAKFARFGVVSFDSTSPLRQAFKDDKDNYYTLDRTYTALRVPQVDGNPTLMRKIKAGEVSQPKARLLERECLRILAEFESGNASVDDALAALGSYESFYDGAADHAEAYGEVLRDRPWQSCPCDICRQLGHHVALFRGAERNRRRGFHNVWVFHKRLHRELQRAAPNATARRARARTTQPEVV